MGKNFKLLSYSSLLFGTDESIVAVDYVSRSILLNISTVDLYGASDPFQRGQKSPKKKNESDDTNQNETVCLLISLFVTVNFQLQFCSYFKSTIQLYQNNKQWKQADIMVKNSMSKLKYKEIKFRRI